MQDRIISWISSNILLHEADVRRWLRRARVTRADEDDLIQEAYCRIAAVGDHSHIESGRAYFFSVVRNLMLEELRRRRIVRIDAMAEIEQLSIAANEPSPERTCTGRQQLALVQRLIEELPERCRAVFKLRRIETLSQRDTAQRLGITENVVEKQVAIGLRTILRRLAETDGEQPRLGLETNETQGKQRGNRRGRRVLGSPPRKR